jgi:hypothetical protein
MGPATDLRVALFGGLIIGIGMFLYLAGSIALMAIRDGLHWLAY